MVEIILKDNIEKNKIDALLHFLKALNINAELKRNVQPINKKKAEFSLSAGIWENYKVDAGELRKQAWKRKK
ncbi:MAG TPA: hypothetical protein VFI29_23810 [Hanamia sp.]|nr:hypothetical protein [Hanamia sp.]